MDDKFRQQVRVRADSCCEYCKLPSDLTDAPFQLDHIIAEKHGGPTTLENFAWSCYFCNTYKGPNIAGWDEEHEVIVRLFHPRKDRWHEHFQWNGPVLVGITDVGKVTIQVLRINEENAVLVRSLLIDSGE